MYRNHQLIHSYFDSIVSPSQHQTIRVCALEFVKDRLDQHFPRHLPSVCDYAGDLILKYQLLNVRILSLLMQATFSYDMSIENISIYW